MNNHQGPQSIRDLEPPLIKAVQAVLSETLPDDALVRVLDRAKLLDVYIPERQPTAHTSASKHLERSPKWFLAWSVSGATAIAAGLLLALFLFSGNTSVSLAAMAAAIRGQPWVHATTTYSNGQQSSTSESWVSTANHTAAIKFGVHRQFDDLATGVSLQYDAEDDTIYRVSMLHRPVVEADLPELLDRIIADKADSRDLFYGERVVKAERREREQNGKQWLEYLIHLEQIGNSSRNRTVRIRLDRATQLPEIWEERKPSGAVAVTRFDYPDSGPRNLYELGVPKTAKLIDRVPKGDLAHIVAVLRAGRKRFDAYDAIVVEYTEGTTINYDHLANLSVKRVRRKGDQYRIDQLLTAKEAIVVPAPGTDMQQWWKENRDRYWSVPQLICDGRVTHLYRMLDGQIAPGKKPNLAVVAYQQVPIGLPTDDAPVEWPQLMPEQCIRPHLWMSDKRRKFDVDTEGNDGPPGTVRVTVTTESGPRSGELFRYWFEPDRDYVLQKVIQSVFDPRTNELASFDTAEYEEFVQSPSGKWFPQVVRRMTGGDPRWQGVTRFYADFEADLKPDLFREISDDGHRGF